MEISLFKLFKIFFNTCFVALVVFLLAVKADTAKAGCCVPVEDSAGNCFSPTNEVCPSLPQSVYYSVSCSSISECDTSGTGGIVESGEDDASETAGNGEKCKPGFTEYSGVCFPDDTGLSEISVKEIIVNVMQWILGIFGFIALIAFAISGIMYLLSAGSEDQVKKAKEAMKWSIVGVIVGLGGLVIVWAIDNALNGDWIF